MLSFRSQGKKIPCEMAPPAKIKKSSTFPLSPQTLKYIIGVSAVFLLVQFFIIQYFFSKMKFTKPLEEKTPWEATKYLLQKGELAGLPIFVIEPSLLRAVREGSKMRVDLWNQQPQDVVTFGVMESSVDVLHKVVISMEKIGYNYWEKMEEDPRGVVPGVHTSYKVIVSHVLLWVPVVGHTPMLIHLVVFFDRGSYFWHSVGQDRYHKPPFDVSNSLFGKNAGSYSKFNLGTVQVDGINVHYPNNSFTFLAEMGTSLFIECNHTRAYYFNFEYPHEGKKDIEVFRRKARQLLSVASSALNNIGVPFWLSSGTCLGWYRQCDLISHTTDVDIGIFITDYNDGVISALENAGLLLTHQFGKVSDSFELSFLYGDLKLDIFFFYVTDDFIWNGGTQVSTGNKYKYIFPPFQMCWTDFLGLWVRVPCPTEPYIVANYGHNWMIPVKGWDWKKSPNNVFENGKWPKREWDEVIQLYE